MIWFTAISVLGILLLVYSAFQLDKSPSANDRMASFIPVYIAMVWVVVLSCVWFVWFVLLVIRIQKFLG